MRFVGQYEAGMEETRDRNVGGKARDPANLLDRIPPRLRNPYCAHRESVLARRSGPLGSSRPGGPS